MGQPAASTRDLADLLRERSLERGNFTLSSGATSSYYIDARRTTMSARGMELVGELGLAAIRSAGWEPELVGGLTLGADPMTYAIARASRAAPPELDAFTVRKSPKGHGTGRRIEGCFRPGAVVVVVEDVITTAGSVLSAIDAVVEQGGHVLGVAAIVDREVGGRAAIEAAGFQLCTLITLADLGLTTEE